MTEPYFSLAIGFLGAAGDEEDFSYMFTKLQEEDTRCGLKINRKKTENALVGQD